MMPFDVVIDKTLSKKLGPNILMNGEEIEFLSQSFQPDKQFVDFRRAHGRADLCVAPSRAMLTRCCQHSAVLISIRRDANSALKHSGQKMSRARSSAVTGA
jgi:hypothetical protein